MAAALNMNGVNKMRLSKSDAEAIAEGEHISAKIDERLRSSSGKTYHTGISFQTEKATLENKMGSVQEVLQAGGIDHAEPDQEENDPNTEVVSPEEGINQLLHMVKNLQSTVNGLDKKFTAVNAFQTKTDARLDHLEKQQTQEKREMSELYDQIQSTQLKVDILSDIVIKQHQEIQDLRGQMLDSQVRSMRNNITISGIPEKANENCIKEVNQFFVDKLQIKDRMIPIEQAYRFGSGRLRPMLIMLRSANDKAYIFQHVSNLKNQKVDGIQCFISSQLPEALNEKRHQINVCLANNKKKPVGERLPFTARQGELLFRNKPLQQKVRPPSPRDLLKLPEPEIERINELKAVEGLYEEQDDSVFKALAATATNHEQVQDLYKKIKLSHGEATHIACAYKFSKIKPPYNEGGCDNYEHGAARVLQQVIVDNGVSDVVLFMVRFYGGKKIGPLRFELIKKAASSAITLWQVSLQDQTPEVDNSWNQQVLDQERQDQEVSDASSQEEDLEL